MPTLNNTCKTAVLLLVLYACDAFVVDIAPSNKPALLTCIRSHWSDSTGSTFSGAGTGPSPTTSRRRWTPSENPAATTPTPPGTAATSWATTKPSSYSPYDASAPYEQTGAIPGVDPCHHGADECWVVPDDTAEEASISPREQELESQIEELRTQLGKSRAEEENTRTMFEALIDMSDNLSRALEAVPVEEKKSCAALAHLCEGIEMTEQGLDKVFEMSGLVKYGEIGEQFDHHYHHALFEIPDPDKEAGTVGQIMKAGFSLDGRVLRYAEVAIVKGKD